MPGPDPLAHRLDGDSGPVLTLLHGGLVGSVGWHQRIPALSGGARVLTLDLPGYGETPADPEAADVDRCVAAVLATWDAAGVDSSFLLGFSAGGMVALRLAATAPERVAGLLLFSTTAEPTAAQRQGFAERAAALERDGLEAELTLHVERAFSPAFRADQPEVVAAYAREIARTDPTAIAATLRLVAAFDGRADLPRIACPTLVVAGAEDRGMPPELAERIAAAIPGATLAVLPDIGHTVHLEAGRAFEHLVAEFVASGGRESEYFRPLGAPERA